MQIEYFVRYRSHSTRYRGVVVTVEGINGRTREVPFDKIEEALADRPRDRGLVGYKRRSEAEKLRERLRTTWEDAQVVEVDLDKF